MLLLTSTSDKVQVITDFAGAIAVHASYMDNPASGDPVPKRNNEASIATAATTDVVDPPASGEQRNVKFLSVRNTHASVVNGITIQHTDGTTAEILWKGTLLVGESVILDALGVFTVYDVNGVVKTNTDKLDMVLRVTANQAITSVTPTVTDIEISAGVPMSFPVKSGNAYSVLIALFHTTSGTTVSPQISVGNVAMTSIIGGAISVVTTSATAAALAAGVATAVDTAFVAQTTGTGGTNAPAIYQATCVPSADGDLHIGGMVDQTGTLNVLAGTWVWVRQVDN